MERTKKLYILSGVLLLLCIMIFAVSSCEKQKEIIQNSDEIILQIETERITAVSWEYKNETMDFRKEENWIYNLDEKFPVDEEVLDGMLGIFEEFGVSFIIEDVEDYSQYGLDDPFCTIHIETETEEYDIMLGDYSSMDYQRYISIGDGNVYLAAEDPLDYFGTELDDLIRHDDTPVFSTISELRFEGTENYRIVYDEDIDASLFEDDVYFAELEEGWKAADSDSIKAYLYNLSYLDLSDCKTYTASESDLEQYGLDTPDLSVSVTYTDGEDGKEKSFILHISQDPAEKQEKEDSDDDSVTAYARVGDSEMIYQILSSEYKNLMKVSYNDLRREEILPVEFIDIEAMEIYLDGEMYRMESEEQSGEVKWYFNEEEVDVSRLESELAYMKADTFTTESTEQKEEIRLVLYTGMEEAPQIEMAFYRYDSTSCLAALDGSALALVPREDVVDLIEAVNAIILN